MDPKRIDRDPQLKLELDYCVPKGIPHSDFLTWSAMDRDKALGWSLMEMMTCVNCGTQAWEWDPKQGGHRRAYVGQVRGCEGCIAKARTEREEKATIDAVPGRRAVLVKNPSLRRGWRLWGGRLGPRARSS